MIDDLVRDICCEMALFSGRDPHTKCVCNVVDARPPPHLADHVDDRGMCHWEVWEVYLPLTHRIAEMVRRADRADRATAVPSPQGSLPPEG